MSQALYRLGCFAARRPWAVIGTWLLVSVFVLGASGTLGRQLEDTFGAPGLDSQEAADLLAAAGSDQVGPTAQVVMTPLDDRATFFASADARAAVTEIQEMVDALPTRSAPPTRPVRWPRDRTAVASGRCRPTGGSP